MFRKILYSISIFTVLFSSAWIINNKENAPNGNPSIQMDETFLVVPINQVINEQEREQIKPFRSREYIRLEPTI